MLVARGYDAAVRYNSTTSTVRELLLKAIDMCEKEGITCLGDRHAPRGSSLSAYILA